MENITVSTDLQCEIAGNLLVKKKEEKKTNGCNNNDNECNDDCENYCVLRTICRYIYNCRPLDLRKDIPCM